ncbi:mate-domain-containing protein [Zychaea mexicana]|uniref:mate-domain-containing protein n=1 Tax=Zychaea mexicana TaxID=64656 RepID=UPI0022FE0523|nr:mate-domain-containing protein [Zychaea mexicana]KAI9491250.1 mate-domain-containing protein [Zychaea mexicana]
MQIQARLFEFWRQGRSIFTRNRSGNDDNERTTLLSSQKKYDGKPLLKGSCGAATTSWSDSAVDLTQFVKRDENCWLLQDVKDETKAILNYTWPLLVTFVIGKGMGLVDVWFLGRLGSEGYYDSVMAVVSLGNLWSTVAGLAFGNGLLTAIDTLVAQAFTGASDQKTLGIILQRGILIMGFLALPICLLWIYTESILINVMGQEQHLAHLTQSYIYVCMPLVYPIFVSTAIRKFLQSLGHMRVTMLMILAIFPFNCLSNYIFLRVLDLGYLGAAFHFAFFHGAILAIYTLFLSFGTDFWSTYWPGWRVQAFHHWEPFLKLGIPGMLSVATEWAFEVCALLTGALGKTSLAGQSIILSVNALLIMIPSALSSAVAVRIGHHAGANRPAKIQMCFTISVMMGCIAILFNASLMYFFKHQIATHFSMDQGVVRAAEELMPVAVLSHIFTGLSAVFSATLNALGKQPIVAAFNLSSYYAVGLPFGLWMTYSYGWGLIGVWSGVVMAGFIKCVGEGAILFFVIDWEAECRQSSRRIGTQEILPTLPSTTTTVNNTTATTTKKRKPSSSFSH